MWGSVVHGLSWGMGWPFALSVVSQHTLCSKLYFLSVHCHLPGTGLKRMGSLKGLVLSRLCCFTLFKLAFDRVWAKLFILSAMVSLFGTPGWGLLCPETLLGKSLVVRIKKKKACTGKLVGTCTYLRIKKQAIVTRNDKWIEVSGCH